MWLVGCETLHAALRVRTARQIASMPSMTEMDLPSLQLHVAVMLSRKAEVAGSHFTLFAPDLDLDPMISLYTNLNHIP